MSFFFVKQKTAYEMRISDWSSDVCSSDLQLLGALALEGGVVADVQLRAAALQVQGEGADVVEELAVVADQQQRARILEQPLLQPQHRVEVEVVGGLVEQQQVARGHQRARQVQAYAPAAGERRHRVLLLFGREPQPVRSEEHTSELQSL